MALRVVVAGRLLSSSLNSSWGRTVSGSGSGSGSLLGLGSRRRNFSSLSEVSGASERSWRDGHRHERQSGGRDRGSAIGVASLVGAVAAVAVVASPQRELSPRERQLLDRCDRLYDAQEFAQLRDLLEGEVQTQDRAPGSLVFRSELLWRLARALRELSLRAPDQPSSPEAAPKRPTSKKELIAESFKRAQEALQVNPDSFGANKWYAITLSDVGSHLKSIKEKIADAYVIRKHFDRAAELNPGDATTRHLIGVWCFTFAELPWYQRQVASVIFGSPPTSSYEEALSHFMAAETLEPNFYVVNTVLIAKCLLGLNRKQEAWTWLHTAVTAPEFQHLTNPQDCQSQAEAKSLLATIPRSVVPISETRD